MKETKIVKDGLQNSSKYKIFLIQKINLGCNYNCIVASVNVSAATSCWYWLDLPATVAETANYAFQDFHDFIVWYEWVSEEQANYKIQIFCCCF